MKAFFITYWQPLAVFIASRAVVFLTLLLVGSYGFGTPTIYGWDAPHYLSLAEHGYQSEYSFTGDGNFIAFFPLYPFIIRLFHIVTQLDYGLSGIIASFLFGLGSAVLLYRLVADWSGKREGLIAAALLAVYPASVFLSSAYTESLFMFLTLLSLYLARKDRLLAAAIAAALACITRMTGVVTALIFLYSVWQKNKRVLPVLAYGSLVSVPFLFFLYFQYTHYGTAFAFMKAQQVFWNHHAVFPWTGLRIFLSSAFNDYRFIAMWRTDAVYLFVMIATMIVSFKKIPRDIWLFGLGIILLTLSNSFILGMGRYMMLVLPFYFYWSKALSRNTAAREMALAVMSTWMVFNTVLFVLQKYIF